MKNEQIYRVTGLNEVRLDEPLTPPLYLQGFDAGAFRKNYDCIFALKETEAEPVADLLQEPPELLPSIDPGAVVDRMAHTITTRSKN
ncbi:hypothetical protein GQS_05715 [Thermococcus sp. 4557]|nr:hypothetical protein GQS_05715 [Thermococcus sp. 4557]